MAQQGNGRRNAYHHLANKRKDSQKSNGLRPKVHHAFLDRIITEVRFFADALWAGLVPPFSAFFNVVLSHYQIRMMHLGPKSIILLDVFAFVCEAMIGIPPSVALLRHFFSLHMSDPT